MAAKALKIDSLDLDLENPRITLLLRNSSAVLQGNELKAESVGFGA